MERGPRASGRNINASYCSEATSPALHVEFAAVEPPHTQIIVTNKKVKRTVVAPFGAFSSVRITVDLQKQAKAVWVAWIADAVEIALFQTRPSEYLAERAMARNPTGETMLAHGLPNGMIIPILIFFR